MRKDSKEIEIGEAKLMIELWGGIAYLVSKQGHGAMHYRVNNSLYLLRQELSQQKPRHKGCINECILLEQMEAQVF